MDELDVMERARAGDRLRGADLQASIDGLLAMSTGLDPLKASAESVDAVREIGRMQVRLQGMAMALVNRQIDLLAGKARVTAEHVNGATRFAEAEIARIARWRDRLRQIGRVLDFFAAVLTGNGEKIVEAAFDLKDGLTQG